MFEGEVKKLLTQINAKNKNIGNIYSKHLILKEDSNSMRTYGIQEYAHSSNNLVNKSLAEQIANKTLEKNKEGLSYINTEWKGNASLEPGEILSSHDTRTKVPFVYECLSNELKLDGGFRQKTKGRAKQIMI